MRLLLEVLFSFTGSLAFAIFFGAPRRCWAAGGCIGMTGWMICRLLSLAGAGAGLATFVAAFAVMLLCRAAAVRLGCPVQVFLVPGTFSLIPGAALYWTAYHLVTRQLPQALEGAVGSAEAVFAILLGIVFGMQLPAKAFAWLKK